MASALNTMKNMSGLGVAAGITDTAVGSVASFGLGVVYGKFRDKAWANWLPLMVGGGGKLFALAIYLASKGRAGIATVAFNAIGQAGLNAQSLDLGVKVGLRLAGKQLVLQGATDALPAGAVKIAGELPPAEPGRSLENISIEDLVNAG